MKRSWFMVALMITGTASPAWAQQLRDMIGQLFIFGSGDQPLFLAGTAGTSNPASVQAHGNHFVPAAVSGNATLIGFLTSAIGSSVANLPIGATSSGQTFRFEGGVPVATSTSSGPVFAERAQTLGRGRVLAGVSVNRMRFQSVRGVNLDDIALNFTHANTDFPGCDTLFGGDCSAMGRPTLENDFIALDLSIKLDVTATVFVVSYGLLDWMDLGVAVPVISTSLRGTSVAEVVPFGGTTATHFFAGTTTSPELSASRFVEGSATGLGDVAGRIKLRLSQSERAAFGILGEARFATGDAENLLGSGHTAVRGLGVVSARFGEFSPHVNVGYVYRSGQDLSDAVLATAGFDHALADWATLAVDVVSELPTGEGSLTIPEDVHIQVPFARTIRPSNIPDGRDDIVNGSMGFKFVTGPGLTVVTNALVPLNRGGLRPGLAWTLGLEYNF
jgi:hypothetical protein